MAEAEALVIEYAKAAKPRRWRWILFGLLGVAVGAGWHWRQPMSAAYERRITYYQLLHVPRPTGRLIVSDGQATSGKDMNDRFWNASQAWPLKTFDEERRTYDLDSTNFYGQRHPGSFVDLFDGELVSPKGNHRLITIDVNQVADDKYGGILRLNCRLCQLGSYWNPACKLIMPVSSTPPPTTRSSSLQFHWWSIDAAYYGRDARCEVEAGRAVDGDRSRVRIPIWLDGTVDELDLQLRDDDGLIATFTGGKSIPLRAKDHFPF